MAETVALRVDGQELKVAAGTSVAAAIHQRGRLGYRRSVAGDLRGPLCGMGICGECRVTINGRRHERGCQTLCQAGMEVVTDG